MTEPVSYPPPDTTPPPARRPRPWKHIAGYTLTALVCLGIGAAAGGTEEPTSGQAGASASPQAESVTTTTTESTSTTEPAAATLTESDVKLTTKILKKECFGSAGCNVQFRINLTYTGGTEFPDGHYEVSYRVKGGEDPMQGTIEIQDGSYDPPEEMVSTSSRSSKIAVEVTDVEQLDY
jgi:hypothetical protein